MKTKTLVVALVAFIPALVASIPAAAEPQRPINVQPIAKQATELKVAGVAAVCGETKAFDVTLTDATGKPIANKNVQLSITQKALGPALKSAIAFGDATTAANGHAIFSRVVGDMLTGNYDLEASFPGDATTLPSKATGNLLVVKAIPGFGWGDVSVSVPASGAGTQYSFTLTMARASDNKTLDNKALTVTMNGNIQHLTTKYGHVEVPFFPQTAKSWDVHVQFDGDDYNQAAAGDHKYAK